MASGAPPVADANVPSAPGRRSRFANQSRAADSRTDTLLLRPARLMGLGMAFLDARIFALLGWVGVGMLVAFGVVVVSNGHWLSLVQLALFLGGSAYLMALNGGIPALLKFAFVFAALINAAGWIWDQYTSIVWYDEMAHFYTSLAITLMLAFLTYRRAETYLSRHHLDFFIVVVSFGVAAGALWEVLEWAILVGTFKDSPASDIVYDSLGAVLAAGLSVWFARRSAF